jgi:hypothetical protein
MTFGLPAQAAKRLGLDPNSVNGTGTSQAGATAIGQFNFYVRANSQSGATAYILTSVAEVGSDYTVFNSGASSCIIWPPVGGQFNVGAGATATGVTIAVGKGGFFLAVTATTFDVLLSS